MTDHPLTPAVRAGLFLAQVLEQAGDQSAGTVTMVLLVEANDANDYGDTDYAQQLLALATHIASNWRATILRTAG